MDKSTHEENLSQPLPTNIKQFKIPVTFSTGFNAIFNVTKKIKNSNLQNQLTMMISVKLVLHQEPTKQRAQTMKLKESLLKEVFWKGDLSNYNQTKVLNFRFYYRNFILYQK